MKMFSTITKAVSASVLAFAASTALAAPINIGGVVWDPDAPSDFRSNGSLVETPSTGVGSTVNGYGIFTQLNSGVPNQGSFCPGCELTFTFSMLTQSITPTGGAGANFEFSNLVINVYVDSTPDYLESSSASAGDGVLWLQLGINGLLTGSGLNIATGSDQGFGGGNLDVLGGLAAANFDTNTKLNGSDFVFTSSFQPSNDLAGLLVGTWDMRGDSIPSPAPLALIGLGLLGMGLARRRMAK